MSYTPFSRIEDLIKKDILPIIFILIGLLITKHKNLIKNKTLNLKCGDKISRIGGEN